MSDRPIIFSAPMIRALLAGTKTQTRRLIKPQPKLAPHHEPVRAERRSERGWVWMVHTDRPSYQFATGDWVAPYHSGQRLWVRETWQHARKRYCRCPQGAEPAPCDDWSNGTGCASDRGDVIYRADAESIIRWRSPIHMPRWASRITLHVEDVRVQRVQEISAGDCYAEGCFRPDMTRALGSVVTARSNARNEFSKIWNSIHGPDAWQRNPWVCALTFRTVLANIDAPEAA